MELLQVKLKNFEKGIDKLKSVCYTSITKQLSKFCKFK